MDDEVHVLLVPFPCESHIQALLRFAHALADYQGLLITFGFPARFYALAKKHNKLSSLLRSASIRVEVVPDGLPAAEDQVPDHEQILASMQIMQNALELLLEDLLTHKAATTGSSSLPPVSCIISDTFVPWTQDLADKLRLPRVDFWTFTATFNSICIHLPELISRGYLPLKSSKKERWYAEAPLIDFIPGHPPFPVTDLPHSLLQAADLSDPMFQFVGNAFAHVRDADTILVHSIYELESNAFDALQAEGFPIFSVGPLFDIPSQAQSDVCANRSECLQWLDKQQAASVVYVALGTIAKLTHEELHAMALGLEAAGHPFLWVIRADSLSNDTLSESLPDGFLERTVAEGKGFIAPWAPQMEVLKHPSVAAFLSHCGWNSTLESLSEGLPMVVCPRLADQRSNARSIVERWKVGIELERQEDGSFTKEAVQKAIQAIMANLEARDRALELKQVTARARVDGGTSHRNLVNFVERLHHYGAAHRRLCSTPLTS